MIHTFAHLHILPTDYVRTAEQAAAMPPYVAPVRPDLTDMAHETPDPMPVAGVELVHGWPQNAHLGVWGEWRGH